VTQAKLLFDECIGKPHIDCLKDFVAIDGDDTPEIKHILEDQGQGVWDDEWIPRIADEGWIIISQDRGKKGRSKGAPLPELCLSFGITHVLLSRRVTTRKSFDKMLTILSCGERFWLFRMLRAARASSWSRILQ